MEWANGDIRCHFPRSHPSFSSSSIQETVVDFHGYTPPPGGQTRLLDYGGSDVVPPGSGRLQECTPNHCGGGGGGGGASYPPTATLTYGITHPNYQITTKSISTHAPSGVYSTDRGPAAGVYMPPPPSRVVGDYAPSYPSAAHQQQQQQSYPGSQSSPPYHSESEHQRAAAAYVGGSCSECPVSATCDYSGVGVGGGTHHHLQHHPSMPPTSCGYPLSSDECHVVRTDLGPLPDIHPEIRSTTSGGIVGDMRHHPHPHHHPSSSSSSSYHHIHHTPPPPPPPQQQQQQGGEMRDDLLRPECYDGGGGGGVGGGLRSHHASHCDLREFEEWREMRGSRESVGTLPPELETHLKQCRCPCDHLGYGNYQSLVDGRVSHISRSHSSCSVDTCRHDPPTVYTQLSYLDSPRSTSSNGFTHRRKAVGGELGTRHWWLVGLVFLVAVTAGVGVGVPLALRGDPKQSLDKRLEIARKILSEYPLIDGHNDLPWNIRSFIHNQLEKLKLNESLKLIEPWSKSNWSHTDLPRLQEGLVGGQFWVAYTPCDSQYLNSVQLTLEQIDLIKRVLRKYNQYLELVTNSEDITTVFKKGKIASLIAIEGGHGISNSLGTLRMMYELGVRYLTLTHACNTPWATSSVVESKGNSLSPAGLTDFGKKVVQEMNRLGMMVDLSHVSTQTMRDTLEATKAPIIFSHSSARALCDNPRNVPDDVLKKVKLNRGIVMVSFFADHISCSDQANVSNVAEHINYIRQVAGIDHVGIGADFDGINKTPEGLEDVSKYPVLLAELLRDPGWTVEDIRKLVGGNIIRVFSEVERVRDDLLAKGVEPVEEEIHPEYLRGKTNCTYFFD